ncbi:MULTISPECIES: hypothetical protein [Kribbella]|nr:MULTISPECIES: hypothetical protein [Kribbella]
MSTKDLAKLLAPLSSYRLAHVSETPTNIVGIPKPSARVRKDR